MRLPIDSALSNSKLSTLELIAQTNASINHAHHLIDELSVRLESGFVGGDLQGHHDIHLEDFRLKIRRERFWEQARNMTFLGFGLAVVFILVLSVWSLIKPAVNL